MVFFSFSTYITIFSEIFALKMKGKPLREALVEIDSSTKAYEWFSEEAKRTYGDLIPSPAPNKRFMVLKQAVGVCAFITPVMRDHEKTKFFLSFHNLTMKKSVKTSSI
jgi:hypothetical protein